MKKAFVLFFLLMCAAVAVFGCAGNGEEPPGFFFGQNGDYTGFTNLPADYTLEEAKKDGTFATQDSKISANRNAWESFVRDASQGKNASVRIVQFYPDNPSSPFFQDLFFKDGNFYLFDSSSDNLKKQPYSYLLALEGRFGNPKRDSGVVVLTNDNTLTFDTVMKSMLSSDMNYIKSVPEFEIIIFV